MIKFLYRYYYTFFLLHKKDVDEGRIKDPAWIASLFQVTAGVGLLLAGLFGLAIYLTGKIDQLKQAWWFNKFFGMLFIVILPFLVLYFLLFNFYKVNKKTGLTPEYSFKVTKKTTLAFWILWTASVILPFFIGTLTNGLFTK